MELIELRKLAGRAGCIIRYHKRAYYVIHSNNHHCVSRLCSRRDLEQFLWGMLTAQLIRNGTHISQPVSAEVLNSRA